MHSAPAIYFLLGDSALTNGLVQGLMVVLGGGVVGSIIAYRRYRLTAVPERESIIAEAAERAVTAMKESLERALADLREAQREIHRLEGELRAANERISRMETDLRGAVRANERLTHDLENARSTRARIEQDLEAMRERVSQLELKASRRPYTGGRRHTDTGDTSNVDEDTES